MMTVIALLLVTALLIAVGTLVLFARVHRWMVRPLVIAGAFVIVGIGIKYTGGFAPVDPALLSSVQVADAAALEDRCNRLTELLRQNRVVIDAPARENAVVVISSRWEQLPEAVREVATTCLAQERGVANEALELVKGGDEAG